MVLYRGRADAELLRDCLVRAARCQEPKDLQLASGQSLMDPSLSLSSLKRQIFDSQLDVLGSAIAVDGGAKGKIDPHRGVLDFL